MATQTKEPEKSILFCGKTMWAVEMMIFLRDTIFKGYFSVEVNMRYSDEHMTVHETLINNSGGRIGVVYEIKFDDTGLTAEITASEKKYTVTCGPNRWIKDFRIV